MNKHIITVLISLITISLSAQDMVTDIWLTGEENTKIETYQKEGMWFGKIISSDNSKAKIGSDILIGFAKENQHWVGKLYAVKRDRTLDAIIIPNDDKLDITVSAGLFKKKLTWLKEAEE